MFNEWKLLLRRGLCSHYGIAAYGARAAHCCSARYGATIVTLQRFLGVQVWEDDGFARRKTRGKRTQGCGLFAQSFAGGVVNHVWGFRGEPLTRWAQRYWIESLLLMGTFGVKGRIEQGVNVLMAAFVQANGQHGRRESWRAILLRLCIVN